MSVLECMFGTDAALVKEVGGMGNHLFIGMIIAASTGILTVLLTAYGLLLKRRKLEVGSASD